LCSTSTPKTYDDLLQENELLCHRLEEAEETIISPCGKAEKTLREMNQRKDEFLATLAHELRNPLAPILTCLQLLRMEDDDPQARRQSYDVIERQTRQLTRLVDDLMDMVRISRGKIKLQKRLVDLAGVVGTAIESSRPLIADRGHRLDVVCAPDPIPVEADPERLAQVIANLLINAAKFTDPGGRIALSVAVEENQAVVRVKDSGVGIAPEMLARVFDPYMQVDRTPQRTQTGLGIGLSLVRGLTEMHGGTVQVHSDGAGKGSEFVVRLPLYSNQPAQERPVNMDQEAGRGSSISRKIMVVDDNRDLADSFAKLLRLMGHEVWTTHDGRQVREAARIFRPDLIFLDIGLPGMDGYAVAEEVRDDATLRSTLLVALTGYGAATDRQRTREAGFSAHLVKPVRFADVHELLDRLLGRQTPRAS
jgi:CheY-like chemotaxis protein